MKYILTALIIVLIGSCTESKKTDKVVFGSSLEMELTNFIERESNRNHLKNNEFYYSLVINSDSIDRECKVIITLMPNVDQEKVSGYAIVNNKPVYCYLLDTTCSQKLINRNNLIEYKSLPEDSIDYNTIYDLPCYIYRIVKGDSLQLIKKFSIH